MGERAGRKYVITKHGVQAWTGAKLSGIVVNGS
jgi:hypothetical protein